MKKVFCLFAAMLFISFAAQPIVAAEGYLPKVEQKQSSKKSVKYWRNMADGMTQSLVKKFWGASFH